MNTVGIAVWGLGNHALNRILPPLSQIKEFNLIGVCSRSEAKVKDCASKWNCHGWLNPNEMLSNTKVDIIYLSSPIGVHFKMALKALKAGKHVWCEKPLTCNYEDTKALVRFANDRNKMITESFMYLHHSQFREVKNIVKKKKLGKLHSIICRFGLPTLKNPGFRNNPMLCGGALWDLACYPVSAVLELLPDQQFQVLYSEVQKNKNFPVDTEGRAILRSSKGISVYLEWGVGVAYKNEIDLWALNGSFYTDKIFSKPENYRPIFRIRDENGNESSVFGEKSEQFTEMFYEFFNMLDSPQLLKIEYAKILERAKIMDNIANYTS
jgi:dTDP-3,4-didehydro-2,6-dideoxy-alpha-D-glucose 3-reductase